jgi:hypothetical protein
MSEHVIKQEKLEIADSNVSYDEFSGNIKKEPELEFQDEPIIEDDDDEPISNLISTDNLQDPLQRKLFFLVPYVQLINFSTDETPLERKRRLGRLRKARFRARLSDEALEKVRRREAEKASRRRATESAEKAAARRLANKLYQQRRRALETPEQSEVRRQADAISHKKRIQSETPEQAEIRRLADVASHKRRRAKGSDSEKNYDEVYVRISSSGKKEIIGYVDPLDSYKTDES